MDLKPLGINVSNFIDSYRNIGYTIETAVADIIDNSIFANAKRIDVNMVWDDYDAGEPYVQIVDDGDGMNEAELIEAMRLACKSPKEHRDPKDLGRFGLGLKSASFSQCNLLTVGSKKEGFPQSAKQWDVSIIRDRNEFLLNHCSLEESGIKEFIPNDHGTIVQWNQIDSFNIPKNSDGDKKRKYWMQIKDKTHNHISKIFGSYKGHINFYFNGNPIQLWDPFLTENNETRVITDEEIYLGGSNKVKIKTFILPRVLSSEEKLELVKNSNLNDLQGFYVYRNNRLIVAGSWLGLKKLDKKDAYRLAHIRIDIDNSMDELWNIDIKKEIASCPPEIQEKLLSYAKQARTESSKVFRTRKRILKRHHIENNENSFIWNYGSKDGRPYFQINRHNPILESFFEDLSVEQRESFNVVMKCIENYIPVLNIIEAESKSNGEYIDNTASDISDDEIMTSFYNAVSSYVEKGLSYDRAVELCQFTEPFLSNYEMIQNYLSDDCPKENV